MSEAEGGAQARLQRRYERERKARREAEAIADRVTAELYAAAQELQRLNAELEGANTELASVNQALRDFMAIASHDLKGPLTSIVASAALLREGGETVPDERRSGFLGIIERQARQMARMCDDLLTISRIEAGVLDRHAEVVELRRAVEAALQDFSEHDGEIDPCVPDSLRVEADPDHLHRILVNYVGNALKYGAPPVKVEAAAAGEWVEIRVRDSGEGVPEEFVPRLFGKFARGAAEAARATGTGLGLSIVRGLAQVNGGDAWYEPNEPRGSCFAVRLPRAAA